MKAPGTGTVHGGFRHFATVTSLHLGVMNEDATTAFLFQCDDSDVFAVTIDEAGHNLPPQTGFGGWRFLQAFPLGVQEVMPKALNPEPVMRGVRNVGYYIWREGEVRNPSGTSQ